MSLSSSRSTDDAVPKPDCQDTAETSDELSSNVLHRSSRDAEEEPQVEEDSDQQEDEREPEVEVKGRAESVQKKPVPICRPKLRVGDAVIAHYGNLALYPNGNFDVQMDGGDVLHNVLSYCVWTEADNSEGLASFEQFKKATRHGKQKGET